MKNSCILLLLLVLNGSVVFAQSIINTSYKNQAGEKVLRFEMTVPVDVSTAWQLFTLDSKLNKWIAPVAHIELKTGGYILTNYDSTKQLTDSTSINVPIINFIENELLVLKVNLNNNFAQNARNTDENLQEIIQFIKIDSMNTKICSSMVGFGQGVDWEKTYIFFEKGNEWTYKELLEFLNNYLKK